MSKQVFVHEFNQQSEAIEWIKLKSNGTVIIPLQPLFIDGVPNILPLQYFFMKEPKDNYPLFNELYKACTRHAPPKLSPKSIRSIAKDCFNLHELMVHSYEWVHAAMKEFNQHPVALSEKKVIEETIRSTAEWINDQHTELVIYGISMKELKLMLDLAEKITIPIHWVVPSIIKASTTLVMDGFTDWIQTWSKQKHHCKSQIMINGFDSIEDECQQVVLHAKTLMGKVALVVPNDQIKDQLVIAANKQNISIRANSVLLKNTLLGSLLNELITWVKKPSIEQFNRLIHAWDWPDIGLVKEKVTSLLANKPYKKQRSLMSEFFTENECAKQLLEISSVHQIKSLFDEWDVHYGLDDNDYFQYQSHQFICSILDSAEKESNPVGYVEFMLEQQTIDAKTFEEPKIICIEPESLGKVPSHSLWVMGLGNETWKSMPSQHYLTSDAPSTESEYKAIRSSYAAWCLSHPQLVGASYAQTVNDRENHLLDGLECEVVRFKSPYEKDQPFKRSSMPTTPCNPLPMSPSSLALYQRCPYAYYIKHHLKISSKAPASEYQVVGFLIHDIVEKLATNELKDMHDIQVYLDKEFNPLMAKVMENTIDSDWPIKDIASFFTSHDGLIETEKNLVGVVDGIQLKGRADLILSSQTGIEVMDVKSGKVPTKKDIDTYDYIQLGVYGLLLKMANPKKPIKASLLSKGPKRQTPMDMADDKYDAYEQGLMQYLKQLLNGLKQSKFSVEDAMSSDKETANLCRVCDYYHACHKKERHQR